MASEIAIDSCRRYSRGGKPVITDGTVWFGFSVAVVLHDMVRFGSNYGS